MKLLIALRLLFLCLLAVAFGLAIFFFAFMGAFSSDDPGCSNGRCETKVLIMTLAVCLPGIAVLFMGWWRSEASIKRGLADQYDDLAWFRHWSYSLS